MQYQGGKSRIAKHIAEIINGVSRWKIEDSIHNSKNNNRYSGGEGDTFVSLFCGSCSVESKVEGFSRIILNDKHYYLMCLLQGVQNGYSLPEYISEAQYKQIRDNKDIDPVLTGFVGFGCSFGGKWFGGYARNKTGTNYALQSKKSLLKDMATLMNAEIICDDYRNVAIPHGAVVYADPPYANTTGYGERFDTDEFWVYMRLLAETGHTVFISELEAPKDFVCVWEKPFTRTLDRNKDNQFKVTEKLFTYAYPYK